MRKTLTAVSVGLLLVAGQAFAAGSNTAGAMVIDRVGTSTQAPERSTRWFQGVPFSVLIIGATVFTLARVALSENDCDTGC